MGWWLVFFLINGYQTCLYNDMFFYIICMFYQNFDDSIIKKNMIFSLYYMHVILKKRDITSFMKQFYLKKCFHIKVNCFMKFKNIFSRLIFF